MSSATQGPAVIPVGVRLPPVQSAIAGRLKGADPERAFPAGLLRSFLFRPVAAFECPRLSGALCPAGNPDQHEQCDAEQKNDIRTGT